MGFSIHHDFIIKSDKHSVYKAISEPEHLENWWPLKCSGIPKVGELYNFNFTDEYDWYAEVTSCKRNDHIHFKMTKSDANWNSTSFGFDLKEIENGVEIQFWHVNWTECNAEHRQASFCWAILLNGLKNYVEKGVIIPFENRE